MDRDGERLDRRLKTIDEIYSEVRGYDLVVTNDIALETALNYRVDFPHVGDFAITPRHIARRMAETILGEPLIDDMALIARIRRETRRDLRYIFSEVQNFREIRAHTPRVAEFLTTSNSRRVYEEYSALPTLEKAMSGFDEDVHRFFGDRRVAVIGVDLFDDLDKHFIPYDCDEVDIFTDAPLAIPEVRAVGNDRQLAENAVALVDPERAGDYAIVLKASSPIADAVRSALYRRDMPFINRMEVRDMAPVRDYIAFLSASFNYDTVRIGQIKELFAAYNGFFDRGTDNYLLSRQDDGDLKPKARRLRAVMMDVCRRGITFAEARDRFCMPKTRQSVSNLLKDLNLEDVTVTPGDLANLRFAVENIADLTNTEEFDESETKGVVIADCTNSVYIDRPVVIYLGMEQDWNVRVVGKRYLDAEEENRRNAMRLSALLQQGQSRLYLVNTTKDGKPARPSLLFDTVFGRKCGSFADVCDRLVPGRWVSTSPEPPMYRGEADMDQSDEFNEPFSKTTFNALAYCPRRYLYSTLLSDDDNRNSAFGNLIHSFAELYVCHRDRVLEIGTDAIARMLAERFAGLSSPSLGEIDRGRIRVAMESIMAYADACGLCNVPLDSSASQRAHPNPLMAALGLDTCSSMCEKDERSRAHQVHGHFDIRWGDAVRDYKTGRAKDPEEIKRNMMLDGGSPNPDFQPLIYLALAMEMYPGVRAFELFYAMDGDQSHGGSYDFARGVRRVELSDRDLAGSAFDDPGFRSVLLEGGRSVRLSALYRDNIDAFLAALAGSARGDPSGWSGDPTVISAVLAAVGKSEAETNRKGAVAAVDKVAGLLAGGIVMAGDRVIVPRDTLDSFMARLDAMHDDVVARSRDGGRGFPGSPSKGCDCECCPFKEACMVAVTAGEEGYDE